MSMECLPAEGWVGAPAIPAATRLGLIESGYVPGR